MQTQSNKTHSHIIVNKLFEGLNFHNMNVSSKLGPELKNNCAHVLYLCTKLHGLISYKGIKIGITLSNQLKSSKNFFGRKKNKQLVYFHSKTQSFIKSWVQNQFQLSKITMCILHHFKIYTHKSFKPIIRPGPRIDCSHHWHSSYELFGIWVCIWNLKQLEYTIKICWSQPKWMVCANNLSILKTDYGHGFKTQFWFKKNILLLVINLSQV